MSIGELVILCLWWDTPSEKTGLWQVPNVYTPFKYLDLATKIYVPCEIVYCFQTNLFTFLLRSEDNSWWYETYHGVPGMGLVAMGLDLSIGSSTICLASVIIFSSFNEMTINKSMFSSSFLKGFVLFPNKKHNVHRFTLNLHSLKIMIVESLKFYLLRCCSFE